jgi:hypothetical protein
MSVNFVVSDSDFGSWLVAGVLVLFVISIGLQRLIKFAPCAVGFAIPISYLIGQFIWAVLLDFEIVIPDALSLLSVTERIVHTVGLLVTGIWALSFAILGKTLFEREARSHVTVAVLSTYAILISALLIGVCVESLGHLPRTETQLVVALSLVCLAAFGGLVHGAFMTSIS